MRSATPDELRAYRLAFEEQYPAGEPAGEALLVADPYCSLAASEIPGFGTDRDTHRCAKLHRDKPLPACGTCLGGRVVAHWGRKVPCPTCRGTGRTPSTDVKSAVKSGPGEPAGEACACGHGREEHVLHHDTGRLGLCLRPGATACGCEAFHGR